MPARSTARPSIRRRAPSLLRRLGLVGWDHLEPAILAALAAEAPLLLIGPHGSAKTLLLARLADALGLVHRQYNASLLNFDDLVGFPVPENGKIVYLQTPSTIWEAESVFFDEISRCRPDLQNKLFPIVHDRVVQGVPLARLSHRWGAMNPPPSVDRAAGEIEYAGAEPLDVALADRFAFVVSVPSFADLEPRDQLKVLQQRAAPDEDAPAALREAVRATREALARGGGAVRKAAAEYIQLAAAKLAEAGHQLSTRRAVQLTANIEAVAAALAVTSPRATPEDSFFCALRCSLPDAAWGRPVSGPALLAAHKAAWEVVRLEADDPLRAIHAERHPLRRIALALASAIPGIEAAQVIADSYAMLSRPARLAVAPVLMPRLADRQQLPLSAVEAVARDFAAVSRDSAVEVTVRGGGADWKRDIVSRQLTGLDRTTAKGRVLTNVAVTLAAADERFELFDVERAYDEAVAILGGATPVEAGVHGWRS